MRKNSEVERLVFGASANMSCSRCGSNISKCCNPKCQKYFEQEDNIHCVLIIGGKESNSYYHYCGYCKGEAKSGK